MTPELAESLKNYPLYAQDGRKKDALCVALFSIGRARWYILEGQPEGNDFILYGVTAGLQEVEYGYISANELSSVSVDASAYGLGTLRVEQDKTFVPCQLADIEDEEIQTFLTRLYD